MPEPLPDLRPALDVLGRDVSGVAAVYLFGSHGRGEAAHDSDIDLAVLADDVLDPVERFRLQEQLAVALGRDVDLVDLRAASTVMQAQIVATGRVVVDTDPGARVRFETVAFSAYALLNEERAGILADIAARGSVYG